jgi:hypothetical protein
MIVITALTGVAVTLINGETFTHVNKVLQQRNYHRSHTRRKNTRLVIIDEISLETQCQTATIERNCPKKVRQFAHCLHRRTFAVTVEPQSAENLFTMKPTLTLQCGMIR